MKFLKNTEVDKDKLMFVNSIYHRPCAATEYEDYLDIIYKDISTGRKYVETKKNPEIIAYLVKPEYRDYNYNKEYMEINKCDQYKVPIKDVNFWIAKQIGPEAIGAVRNMMASGNRAAIQNFQKYKFVFGTDTDIRSFYMTHWLLEYENDMHKELSYGAADIETDAIKHPTFASNGEVPILCATFVSEINRQVHTFVYRAPDNLEQIARVEDHADEFVEECHRCFDEAYGSDFEYNLYFFDRELDMIKAYYQVINDSDIDILYYWNGNSFDNPYIKARIKILGGDPAEIVSHPDFKVKKFEINKDTRNFQVVNKRDWVTTSTYYQTVDHMLSYTQLRKGSVTLRTNKLNDIARAEIGDTKLDYSETGNIRTLPYLDFWTYLIYNIKDVLLEIGIERKTTDLQAYYVRSYSSSCPYEFIFAQTKFLQSRMYYEYQLENIVPWNNINIDYGAPIEQKEGRGKDIGFSGALVGDPLLLDGSISGELMLGKRSNRVFRYVIDFDYTALYPSIIISHNISPATMIAKLLVNESVEDLSRNINKALSKKENDMMGISADDDDDDFEPAIELEDQGMHFLDDYQTGNTLNVGSKWFNLPTTAELSKLVDERFNITHDNIISEEINHEKKYRIG